MGSRPVVASKNYLVLTILLVCAAGALGAARKEGATVLKKEDQELLKEVRLPQDPKRSPEESYFQRFVIRTEQAETFVAAYWYEQGNVGDLAVDIFALETTPKGKVGRRVYSGALDAGVLALKVTDFDGDGRDDLIFVTKTGGMIVTTGVIALRQTPSGFFKVLEYAGSDILVYRELGQVRILVKAKTDKEVLQFTWNPSKKTFEATATFELLY